MFVCAVVVFVADKLVDCVYATMGIIYIYIYIYTYIYIYIYQVEVNHMHALYRPCKPRVLLNLQAGCQTALSIDFLRMAHTQALIA